MPETPLLSARPPLDHAPEPVPALQPTVERPPENSLADRILRQQLRPEQLAQAAGAAEGWLWHGYLATGQTTLLTSQWKSGKSTLIGVLLARMARGGTLGDCPWPRGGPP